MFLTIRYDMTDNPPTDPRTSGSVFYLKKKNLFSTLAGVILDVRCYHGGIHTGLRKQHQLLVSISNSSAMVLHFKAAQRDFSHFLAQ